MAKKQKVDSGKNIRVTTEGWLEIRAYCFKNNLKMGAFVEATIRKKISSKNSVKRLTTHEPY